MLDPGIIELINAGIDGELGPEEQRKLGAVLDSMPEAAALRLELLKLNNAFGTLPELEPPPGLAHDILDQVQLPAGQKIFKFRGFPGGLNPVAGGLAFAAGLLLAVGFYEAGLRKLPQQDTINMVGTMVASDRIKTTGQGDRLQLDMDGLSGVISLNVIESGQALEFDLNSDELMDIELNIGNAGLMVQGFARGDRGNGSFIETLELSGGTMRVAIQGRLHFVLFMKQTPGSDHHGTEISIGISREGEGVYEDTLSSRR